MKFFLIGMMGSGKSYWAQYIAGACAIDWMDLDAEIEKETAMSIRDIFETEGEAFFRTKEKEALHLLAAHQNIVIATGGGTPCFHNNMEWMNRHGITIWIDEPVEILVQRLGKEKAQRPLLQNLGDDELYTFLSGKLEERKTIYSKCQYHLQGTNINENQIIQIIRQHA